MADTLKPCPFCSARLERSEAFSNRSADCFVHPSPADDVPPCLLNGVVIWSHNDERIAAWNRRADDARIATLEAAIETNTKALGFAQNGRCAAEAELERLRKGIAEIMAGVVAGEVGGEDVVWFSTIETLWEFCGSLLAEGVEFDPECSSADEILALATSAEKGETRT